MVVDENGDHKFNPRKSAIAIKPSKEFILENVSVFEIFYTRKPEYTGIPVEHVNDKLIFIAKKNGYYSFHLRENVEKIILSRNWQK